MRQLFICDTPFQVLNALNFFWHSVKKGDAEKEGIGETDLVIVDQFSSAKDIGRRIEESGLFSHVYMVKQDTSYHVKNRQWRRVRVAVNYLFPRGMVRHHMGMRKIPENCYQRIYSSVLQHFTSAMLKLNPGADFYLLDDGTGSYSGSIISQGSALMRVFAKLSGTGAQTAHPKALYVNNVDMCRSETCDTILPLPKHDAEFIAFVNGIYDVNPDQIYKEKKFIWFTQPSEGSEIIYGTKEDISDLLRASGQDNILVRLHPRDKETEIYHDLCVDEGKAMWELIIPQCDIEDKVLVALYSTAQFTPKLLYDKEPRLIFLHHLVRGASEEGAQKGDERVANLVQTYRDKEKIMIPQNQDEFLALLQELN